jgi:hypothetical protein
MTHADITANEILEQLPTNVRSALQRAAIRRKVPMTTLIKEGLLKIADEINSAPANPVAPARYQNANAA